MEEASDELTVADTTCDDIAFWLYTSGSTGTPKGAMHLQSDTDGQYGGTLRRGRARHPAG